jgi:hypothetical protein
MRVNSRVEIFLLGLVFGLSLSFVLALTYKHPRVVTVDLKKIIKSYSATVVNAKQPSDAITQDFKDKFERAIRKYPLDTLIIAKGQVLSKQLIEEDTENFLQSMGIPP